MQLAIGKGEALLHATNCLTWPSFGLPAHHMRRVYKAVVLPKVEYVLPVWYAPIQPSTSGGHTTGAVRHTRELEKVQRLTCKLITGAFHMTTSDILDVHTHVPPVVLRLTDTCHCEALRICALPTSHPLSRPALRASRSTPCYHRSPLHMLLRGFNLRPDLIETVNLALQHPTGPHY